MCASWVSHQHGGTCSWSSVLTHSSDDSLLQSLQSCTKYVLVEEEGNRILMSNLWTPTAALLDSCWYCYPHSAVKHDYTAYQKEQKCISDEQSFSCLLLEPDRARQTLHLCPFFFFLNGHRIGDIIKILHILYISPFILGLAWQLCSWKQQKSRRNQTLVKV